jgi:hypothetical protein
MAAQDAEIYGLERKMKMLQPGGSLAGMFDTDAGAPSSGPAFVDKDGMRFIAEDKWGTGAFGTPRKTTDYTQVDPLKGAPTMEQIKAAMKLKAAGGDPEILKGLDMSKLGSQTVPQNSNVIEEMMKQYGSNSD